MYLHSISMYLYVSHISWICFVKVCKVRICMYLYLYVSVCICMYLYVLSVCFWQVYLSLTSVSGMYSWQHTSRTLQLAPFQRNLGWSVPVSTFPCNYTASICAQDAHSNRQGCSDTVPVCLAWDAVRLLLPVKQRCGGLHCWYWYQAAVPALSRTSHLCGPFVMSHILGKLPLLPAGDFGIIPLRTSGGKDHVVVLGSLGQGAILLHYDVCHDLVHRLGAWHLPSTLSGVYTYQSIQVYTAAHNTFKIKMRLSRDTYKYIEISTPKNCLFWYCCLTLVYLFVSGGQVVSVCINCICMYLSVSRQERHQQDIETHLLAFWYICNSATVQWHMCWIWPCLSMIESQSRERHFEP